MSCASCTGTGMGQFFPQPYQYGYQAPYLTSYAPAVYQDYNLMPLKKQAYNEYDRYSSFWLQPIDSSMMPDSPIPGFQGMGQMLGSIPKWALIAGGAAALFFLLRKK